MRHTFELKLPKFLDRKLNETPEEEAARIESMKEQFKKAAKTAGPVVVVGIMGYLMGYNRGASKLTRHDGALYIIK